MGGAVSATVVGSGGGAEVVVGSVGGATVDGGRVSGASSGENDSESFIGLEGHFLYVTILNQLKHIQTNLYQLL